MPPEQHRHLFNVALLCLLVGIARLDWVLSSLYHSVYSPLEVTGAVAALLTLVFMTIGPIMWVTGTAAAERISRSLVVVVTVYLLQTWLRVAMFPTLQLTALHKTALLSSAVAVSALCAFYPSVQAWARLRRALTGGAIVFAVTPFAMTFWQAPTIDLTFGHDAPSRSSQTLYVVLDEMSSATQDRLVASLRAAGAHVASTDVPAVGNDTLHVLPAMFSGPLMLDARVCTFSAVCGRINMFDFAKVRLAKVDAVHIVGFFHPYCAVSGWHSCVQLRIPGPSALRSLACTFSRLLPTDGIICSSWINPNHWLQLRESANEALYATPFWQHGGILFAHLPYPHPPGTIDNGSLAIDYAANLNLAVNVTLNLWFHASRQFGQDFRIVITSDHPLRKQLWCGAGKYKLNGCDMPAEFFTPKVPFLVAAPQAFPSPAVKSNANLFQY